MKSTEAAAMECEFRDEHPALRTEFDTLKERVVEERKERKETEGQIFDVVRSMDQRLSRIEGSIDGAFKAKKVAGAVLGVVVSVGASAILGLLLALLKGG
jgi:2,3-bisphosphoglycerate-independent phosphoglycerate mutase